MDQGIFIQPVTYPNLGQYRSKSLSSELDALFQNYFYIDRETINNLSKGLQF